MRRQHHRHPFAFQLPDDVQHLADHLHVIAVMGELPLQVDEIGGRGIEPVGEEARHQPRQFRVRLEECRRIRDGVDFRVAQRARGLRAPEQPRERAAVAKGDPLRVLRVDNVSGITVPYGRIYQQSEGFGDGMTNGYGYYYPGLRRGEGRRRPSLSRLQRQEPRRVGAARVRHPAFELRGDEVLVRVEQHRDVGQVAHEDLLGLEQDGGALVRVIAGEFAGTQGPAKTHTPIHIWDLRLNTRQSLDLTVPEGYTALLVIRQGATRLQDGTALHAAEVGMFDRGGNTLRLDTAEHLNALLLLGEPLDEPIVGRGPFVMNTAQEIHQALADYQSGKMGRLSAAPREPEISP